MEVAGLAIGIAGLAGIFSTCLDVVEKIDSYKDAETDSRAIISQFNAYRLLFQQWGEAVGFDKSYGLRDDHHQKLDDPAIFTAVQDLLVTIHELDGSGGVSTLNPRSELDPPKSGDRMLVRRNSLFHTFRDPLSRRKKVQWALRDNKRFDSLVQRFGVYVNQLRALVPLDQESENVPFFDPQSVILELRKQHERDMRRDLETWLDATHTRDLYDQSVRKRLDGTCDWILKRDAFGEWESSSSPPEIAKILWINGPAGYGKTLLSARITQHLTSLDAPVAAFFFSADLEDRADPYIVMRSWISQMTSHNQDVFELAYEIRESRREKTASQSDIVQLFKTTVQVIPVLTFIVDGLDECTSKGQWGSQRDSLTAFLQEMTRAVAGTSSRILMISREDQDIREGLFGHEVNNGELKLIEYKITPDDVKADAAMLSQSIVDRKLSKKSQIVRNELSQRIVDQCDSMFLRIKLLENDLSDWKPQKALERVVDQAPKKLSHLYDRNWKRIMEQENDRNRAFSILRWAAFAMRPLTILEITEALLLADDDYADSLEEGISFTIDEHYVKEGILALCASLVETRTVSSAQDPGSWTLHLSHFTVREYILSHMPVPGAQMMANETLQSTNESIQNNILAKACLQYLCIPRLWEDSQGNNIQRSFKEYAASSWYQHTKRDCVDYEEVLRLIISFFRPGNAEWEAWRKYYDDINAKIVLMHHKGEIRSANRLFYASMLGFQEVIHYLLTECKIDVNAVDESKRTALLAAAYKNRYAQIQYLLENGADVNIASAGSRTPLYVASSNGNLPIVKLLQERGADLNVPNGDRWTPLNRASAHGHIEIVKLLLEKGADLNIPSNKNEWTPLNSAAENGHVEVVKFLLEQAPESLNVPCRDGRTPLYNASNRGFAEVVKLLLEKGADLNFPTHGGWVPLMSAASSGHVEVVRLLLEKEAHVDIPNQNGWTALNVASDRGHVEVVNLLLEKGSADINTRSQNGWTPLNSASESNHVETVELLLEKGADINTTEQNGWTPLNYAANRGHVEVVKLLLEKGADMNIPNRNRWTPLNCASDNGHVEVVKLLLEKGADMNIQNQNGWTPLNCASDNGHVEIVKLLLEKGADLTIQTDYGWDPINSASRSGHVDIVGLLLEKGASLTATNDITNRKTPLNSASFGGHIALVKLLLEKGADPAAKDIRGETPLSYALASGHADIVDVLLGKGAKASFKDNLGRTPIFFAIEGGQSKVFDLVKPDQTQINIRDCYGMTVLSVATRWGREAMVNQLLAIPNIDINSKDNFGRTPLWWARKQGHVEIEARLLGHAANLGITAMETELKTGDPASFNMDGGSCDVCRAAISGAYYHCADCIGGDFDMCLECQGLGAHCLVKSHTLSHKQTEDEAQ